MVKKHIQTEVIINQLDAQWAKTWSWVWKRGKEPGEKNGAAKNEAGAP